MFYRVGYITLLLAVLSSCGDKRQKKAAAVETTDSSLVCYPGKGPMKLITDRAPQLETPNELLKHDFTPNEFFFVRWHLSQLVTRIDADTFRLRISGAVEQELALSLHDLKTKFAADSVNALCICSGNSRSAFEPKVPGTQWKNGGMGNAKWKGVRVRDLLQAAGMKGSAVDVSFTGMDKGALPSVPAFSKSLRAAHALDSNVLIAYEMNNKPIPLLNGYPLKLVVPGWYASYWVGALGTIEVHSEAYRGFWMERAYKIANNKTGTESPDNKAKETVPLTDIKLHSVFVVPEDSSTVAAGKPMELEGLAFDNGTGIAKVEVSTDGGKQWQQAILNPSLGRYAWRRWKMSWTPTAGQHRLCVRSTDVLGNSQPMQQWNRSGYARNFVEQISVSAQ